MPATLSYELGKLITQIPGYDPFATAGACTFDEERAWNAIEFFHECLTHIEGQLYGQPFVLANWEQSIVANLFGWYRPNGTRRYRECLIFVPRKNGKTPLAAGLGIYHLFCDPERGQQNYVAATTREQAGLLFRHCRGMIEQEPVLASRCQVYGGNAPGGQAQSLVNESTSSFLKVIAGDTKVGAHGKNANLVIVDEVHEQPSPQLIETLRTSMASKNKPQPLLIFTTTSDYNRPSICNDIHDYACKVRDGLINDPAFLPVIYEATIDDDWTSERTWEKANPNLEVSVSLDYLRRECLRAQESPSYENAFKRLHLNIRTEQDIRWLQMDKWDECNEQIDLDALAGQSCWCGLDLAATTDIAAFVMAFMNSDGRYIVVPRFWVPTDSAELRERRDRVPYTQWIRDGLIVATGNNSIDFDTIERDILALNKRYNIVELAADPWEAKQMLQSLAREGLTVFEHPQTMSAMSSPTKTLERAVLERRVIHGGNPVLRWMASNVTVEQDNTERIRPIKKRSTGRIDGIVAAIMAVGRASMANGDGPSYYETHDLDIW